MAALHESAFTPVPERQSDADRISALEAENAALKAERDAARAWAAAWKRAAKRWREVHLAPTTVTLRHYLDLAEWSIGRRAERRAQRISRAAEAMERAAETGTVTRIDRVLTVEERKALFDAGKGALEAMERR